MTLETADFLRTSANAARFSDMSESELLAARIELAETLDSMEASGASCSPLSGFEITSGFYSVVCSLLA